MGNQIQKCPECHKKCDVDTQFDCTNICHAPPTLDEIKNAFVEACEQHPLNKYITHNIAMMIADEYLWYDRIKRAEWENYIKSIAYYPRVRRTSRRRSRKRSVKRRSSRRKSRKRSVKRRSYRRKSSRRRSRKRSVRRNSYNWRKLSGRRPKSSRKRR